MAWRDIAQARAFLASEIGPQVQDWGGRVPIALVYPNAYAVGMSSLAMHALYRYLNAFESLVAERAFAWLDRPAGPQDPVLLLESQRPIREAAVIAATLSFEMDYFHLLDMLRREGIPLRASDREEGDPLILLGGPAISANPVPLAPVADAILIGEIEPVLEPLQDTLAALGDRTRAETLTALAKIPGVYVPLLHQGEPIVRQWAKDLDAYPTTSAIIAPRAEFGDMYLVEISRGCHWGCRFCLAGQWYRPYRERTLEVVLEHAKQGLGYLRRIGLVSAATSDYSRLDEMVTALGALGAEISVSSLRIAPLSYALIEALVQSGSQSITLAPEAGSERLRHLIRKGITHEDILKAVEAVKGRFASLKLYFMIGLPTEEGADIEELLSLVREIRRLFDRQIVVNITPFVPKAHTPWERMGMAPAPVLEQRLARLREGCQQMRVALRAESVAAARVQAVLARGGSDVGEALLAMPRPTMRFFERAFARIGSTMEEALAEKPSDAPLPWDFVRLFPPRETEEKK